ncbi:MAG: hypothetical protein COB50_05250 [Thiotrichales bacterium]|nr:MAG: hypothetical protein COB50_05250 [Thiotrichales bacterium]
MKKTAIPKFKNPKEEYEFWQNNDSTDYIDWEAQSESVRMPNLKPSTKKISLRLPETLLSDIKILANREDVPYQSLMKVILYQWVRSAIKLNK